MRTRFPLCSTSPLPPMRVTVPFAPASPRFTSTLQCLRWTLAPARACRVTHIHLTRLARVVVVENRRGGNSPDGRRHCWCSSTFVLPNRAAHSCALPDGKNNIQQPHGRVRSTFMVTRVSSRQTGVSAQPSTYFGLSKSSHLSDMGCTSPCGPNTVIRFLKR